MPNTKELKQLRPTRAQVRKLIEERGECADCGSKVDLSVDHVIPIAERPDLARDPQNLRVVCWTCHKKKTGCFHFPDHNGGLAVEVIR